MIFWVISLVFLKRVLENKKLRNKKKLDNYKLHAIAYIIIPLLFHIIIRFETQNEGKKHISQLLQGDKFLDFYGNSPIMPLMSMSDFDISLGCENESIDQGRSYVDKNIDISNCYFSRVLSISEDGGVICVYEDFFSMNIEYSMFYHCVSSSDGGAIYFSSSNASIRMICANSCAASYGHFACFYLTQMNQVEYLSILNCSQTTSSYYSFLLQKGDQRVVNTNSSMNKAIWVSGIRINNSSSFISSHCTFSDNLVSDKVELFFYSYSEKNNISYTNIVQNLSPSSGVVFITGAGTLKMMYCIFKNNQNYLFCVDSGSIEVIHSFIDHSSSSFSTSTTVLTTTNNSFTNRVTYQLEFFNSLHCNADIPLPYRTPEDTPKKYKMKPFEQTLET